MSKNDIGIDLGTTNTLIYLKSKGIVLNEPSVVAKDSRTGKIIAVGNEAKKMIGRTPDGIVAVKPMKSGVVSDFNAVCEMLSRFLKKILKNPSGLKARAIISVPSEITTLEKRILNEVAQVIGLRRVCFVEKTMSSAIGAGVDVDAPFGNMIVDIGGGSSEVSVISLSGIVVTESIRHGGDSLDNAIIKFVKKKYGIICGGYNAEQIKIKIGTVMNSDASYREQVFGRNVITGMPCSTYVTGEEIRCAILPEVGDIVDAVKSVLEKTPPDLSADILSSGILLTGGGALIDGIDRMICTQTQMPVRIADNPLECTVIGSGILLGNREKKFK